MPVTNVDCRAQNSFTVEQLVLIRKLKETGISKDQVAQIFDSYDRLDQELGSLYNIPVALALQAQALQQFALHGKVPTLSSFTNPDSASTDASSPASVSCANDSTVQSNVSGVCSTPQDGTRTVSSNSVPPSVLSATGDSDIREFLGFIGKGDAVCCEEIHQFVTRHGIKQQQIAVLSGICQSYVSRFLKGDLYEMSERSRHAICKWYLKYRSNPGMIGPAANLALMVNNASNETNQSQMLHRKFFDPSSIDLNAMAANPSISELFGSQRRERFVFRACQIEILEKYFQESSYPTTEVRAEIAVACNQALEQSVGRKLSDRETVTVQIVSNWFANKRKDLKKAAKEGGHDVSDLLLRSRGRPPQLFYCSGTPNEQDSNGYENANFASDDSFSEGTDQCGTMDCSQPQGPTGGDRGAGTEVRGEAEHVNRGYSSRTDSTSASVSSFMSCSSFNSQPRGIDGSPSILFPGTGASRLPDASYIAAASGHS